MDWNDIFYLFFIIACLAFIIWHIEMVKTRRTLSSIKRQVTKMQNETCQTKEAVLKFQTESSNAENNTLAREYKMLKKSVFALEKSLTKKREFQSPISSINSRSRRSNVG